MKRTIRIGWVCVESGVFSGSKDVIDGLVSLPVRQSESQEVNAKNKFKLILKQLMNQSREGELVFSFLPFGLFSLVEIAFKGTLHHDGIYSLSHLSEYGGRG